MIKRGLAALLLAGWMLAGAADLADAAKAAKVVVKLQQAGKGGAAYKDVASALRGAGYTKGRTRGSHEQWQHPKGEPQTLSPHGGKVPGYQVEQVLGKILSDRLKDN